MQKKSCVSKETPRKSSTIRVKDNAKQQKESLEVQNKVAEIKLRCERKIGEMLKEMPKNPGAATPSQDVTALPPTLNELGIGRMDSSRWQSIADLPEEKFEEHIAAVKASNEELTTIGLIKTIRGYLTCKFLRKKI